MSDVLASVPDWVLVPAVFVVCAAAMVAVTVRGLRDPSPAPAPATRLPRPAAAPEAPLMPVDDARPTDPTDPYGALPDSHLLAPAPTAATRDGRTVTLAEWLRRETGRDGVWTDVVAEFYSRAAAAPAVAGYFAGVDLAQLQRHFLAALVMVTGRGMTVGTVRRMGAAHADVRDPGGRAVTGEVWAAVLGTLVGVLAEHGVPATTLGQLGAAVAPLRAAIVVDAP